jgi:asparagine synthase (glutamine-hydrolysing)
VVSSANPDGITLARHWDIDPGRELRYADESQYAEHLRELCERAVAARLRGIGRAAVLLSGGVDSSSVAAVSSTVSRVDVGAYHHALRGFPDASEESDAARVAGHCGLQFVPVPFEGANFDHHLEIARRLEDSIPGTLGTSDDELASRMTRDGCGVVLSGVGGDEWFAGSYLHSADLIRRGRFIAGARQLWADGHHPDAFHGVGVLAKSCAWALAPDSVRRLVKRVLPARDLVPEGFNRAFAADVSLVDRIVPPRPDPRFPTLAAAVTYTAAMHPHGIYAWEESARQAGMFGNQFAAPLLDRRIAEFAMAIPEEQRWSGHVTKRVLRASMTGLLPDAIRMRRRKSDPASLLLAELQRLNGEGAFARMDLCDAGILDAPAVQSMYEEMQRSFAAGQDRYKVLAYRLWTFAAGECVWRTRFGRHAQPVPLSAGREGISGAETPAARCG